MSLHAWEMTTLDWDLLPCNALTGRTYRCVHVCVLRKLFLRAHMRFEVVQLVYVQLVIQRCA